MTTKQFQHRSLAILTELHRSKFGTDSIQQEIKRFLHDLKTSPVEERIGCVAVEQRDGSFLAVTVGLQYTMKDFSIMLHNYQTSKKANRLVRGGCVDLLMPTLRASARNAESYIVVTDRITLTSRMKEMGARYGAIKRFGTAKYQMYSLSDTNETRTLFSTRSNRELARFETEKANQPIKQTV